MAKPDKDIAGLILKFLREELSVEERLQLDEFLEESPMNRRLFARLTQEESLQSEMNELYEAKKNIRRKIDVAIAEEKVFGIARRRRIRYISAAAILLLFCSGAYLFYRSSNSRSIIAKVSPNPSGAKTDDVA